MSDDWREVVDPGTGRKYYANVKTRETSWDPPVKRQGSDPPPPPPPMNDEMLPPPTMTDEESLRAQLETSEGKCRLLELSADQMRAEVSKLEGKLEKANAQIQLLQTQTDALKRENASLKKSLDGGGGGVAPSPNPPLAAPKHSRGVSVPAGDIVAAPKALRSGTVSDLKFKLREAEEWVTATDQKTGKEYYYHAKSGTTSWERPKVLGGVDCVWKAMPDANSGKTYYYNADTKETSWEKPEALKRAELEAATIREALENKAILEDKSDDDGSDEEYDAVSTVRPPAKLTHQDSAFDLDLSNLRRRASVEQRQESFADIKTIQVHQPVDESDRSLTPAHMKNHNLPAYAAKHFQQLKSGVFSKQTTAEMLSFSKKPLSGSLHTPPDGNFSSNAQQTFRNIQSFMGDRKSGKGKMGHVTKLTRMGLVEQELLRDEIVCQLCKQVTNNPDRESKMKGWTLMAIVLGVFAPTKRLTPAFQTFLRECQNDFDSNVATCAKYCEDRLYLSLEKGRRTTTPSNEEVRAVEEQRSLNFRLYFPRGESKNLAVHSQTSTVDVVVAICRLLGLPLEEHGHIIWGVYQVTRDQSEVALSFGARLLDTRQLYKEQHQGDDKDNELRLAFKPRLFYESVYGQLDNEPIAEMYFKQAVQDIVDSYYITSPKEAIAFAAFQYVADYGDDESGVDKVFNDRTLPQYFPKHILQKFQLDHGSLRATFLEEKAKLGGMSKLMARRQYLQTAQALPMYGCNFFPAERELARGGSEEVIIGISERGIYTMHPVTKEPLGKPVKISDITKFDQRHEDVTYITDTKETSFKSNAAPVLYNRVSAYRQALVADGLVKPRARTIVE